MTPVRVGVVLLLCLGAAGPARAAEHWGVLTLPGGVTAARQVIGLGRADRPPVTFIMDLARRLHGTPIQAKPEIAERLDAYLAYLDELTSSLDQWKAGLSLAAASDRRQRDRLRDTLEQLGLRLESREETLVVTVGHGSEAEQKATWLRAVGCDVSAIAVSLTGGETVTITWPTDELPLPLAEAWPAALDGADRLTLRRLILDPKAMLFYVGLSNLETATADWLLTKPTLVRRLYDDLAGSFALLARSLKVHDGRVVVPGAAAPVWEDLADTPLVPAESFVRRLLERDDGRLAYFYDAVSMLDADRRDFLLGARLTNAPKGEDRRRYVRGIYERFVSVDPVWKTSERPFMRPSFDPGFAIAAAHVRDDGTVGPSWWPALFEDIGERPWPNRMPTPKLSHGRADAQWLLEWLFSRPAAARERFDLLRFAQRLFADLPEAFAPEVTMALLARRDLPALALSLERMGIRAPATYAAAAAAARRLTYAGGAGEVAPAVRGWQAALAVLEQVARHRPVPAAVVDQLVRSLAAATRPRPAAPSGVIATWVLDQMLPALGAETADRDATESATLAALLRRDPALDVTLQWEGIPYRIDLEGPALESAVKIRDAMPGPRLPHVVTLRNAAVRLGGRFGSVADLRALSAELAGVTTGLDEVLDPAGHAAGAADGLRDAIRRLERIREGRNLSQASREQRAVLAALDAAVAEVLAGFAHALALAPSASPARMYADAARFHDFGPTNLGDQWRVTAWTLPTLTPRPGGGTALSGALVGIDIARAAEHLRKAPLPGDVVRPIVSDVDRRALAERVVLGAPTLDWAPLGTAVAGALRRGRALVASWVVSTPVDHAVEQALANAMIDPWRSDLVRFLLARKRGSEVAQLLTITELYRLGHSDSLNAAWGPSAIDIDGCWCLAPPAREQEEFWVNRRRSLAAVVALDVQLRITELLDEGHLPHALLTPLLPLAVQDVLDQAEQIVADDREAFAWPRRLQAGRLEAYLLDLVAQHTLTTPRTGQPTGARR